MPFKDVREFIAKLEELGEAQRIEEEVDWNLEVGAMLRRATEEGLPAPFFQKIKGYPDGYRIFGGGWAGFRRIAISLGMDPNTHPRELMEEFLLKREKPIKPVLVKEGPCKENVHIGDEVDLLEFPVPLIHDGDGGRYIGTWHATITKDLNTGWVNWGMYRHMLHDKTSCAVLSDPYKHLGQMFGKSYEPENKPMEVAIAIGMEPVSSFCAASPLPWGYSEVDLAGGLRGEPVELIKCETVDLAVPATSEIVIEGEIRPHERRLEGPFGEWTGYRSAGKQSRQVIHVKAVTHRNNPILTMSCMGMPVDDNCIMSITKGAGFLEALRARGLPITGVYVPPEIGYYLVIVATKALYANIANDISHVVWGSSTDAVITPWLIVVEDDVDPFDLPKVFHALVSRCNPSRGIVKLEHTTGSHGLPFTSQQEKKILVGSRAYFDCTWPKDWDPADIPQMMSFTKAYPLEVQQKVLDKWHRYGY